MIIYTLSRIMRDEVLKKKLYRPYDIIYYIDNLYSSSSESITFSYIFLKL